MPALFMDVAVRAALIALGTACILWALRVRTADARHAAWTSVVLTMLLLPIWSVAGPKMPLAVLPADTDTLKFAADPVNLAPQPSVTQPNLARGTVTASPVSDSTRGAWVFIGVYLLGACALLVRLGIGTVHVRRLRRMAVVHLGRATSARCTTPITLGWLSPVLILPEGWERWSAAQLDAVLTHEREHVRRHDPLVQWLALLNRAIFWFHPVAWWLERRLAVLAEEACDAAVIRAGHSPQDYSDYLIDMARALRREGRRLNVGLAMPGSGLPDRMRHIFEKKLMAQTSRTRVICTLAFCTTSSVIFAAAILAPRSSVARPQATAAVQVNSDVVLPKPMPSKPVNEVSTGANIPEARAPLSAKRDSGRPMAAMKTDFSGNWTLVSSTYAGRGRGGTAEPVLREVKVSIASGAPVNCGTECTIVQNAKALTISRSAEPVTPPPDNGVVVLHLDGSESTIVQSNGETFAAHATWDGETLVVTREIAASYSVTQSLSIQDGKLTVVTTFSLSDAPVTLTYVKK